MSGSGVETREVGPGVHVVTFRNPPHNGFTTGLCAEVIDTLNRLSADPELRALVITSEGSIFSGGADLKEVQSGHTDPTIVLNELLDAVVAVPVPVIAAINGHAAGGGLELAVACDIRLAAPNATFTASAVNVGLFAGWHRLPRLIGLSRATEMLLTGLRYSSADAESWGLVRVARDADVLDEAIELALRIGSRAPLSVRALVQALRGTFDVDDAHARIHQNETFAALRRSEDHAEALSAFFAKRTPDFHAR